MITTAGIARDGKGRFFVAKRKSSKNLRPCWEFPGGKAAEGETPEQALQREFREEFGVEINIKKLFCTDTFSSKKNNYTLHAYHIEIKGRPEKKEHLEMKWKTGKQLQQLRFAPSDRKIAERLIDSD